MRRPQEGPKRWSLALGATFAVLVLVYLPLFLGRVLFYRDIGRWLLPARAFLRQAFAAGESVLYNPHEGLGLPIAASPLYGVFYPTSWLGVLGGSEARLASFALFLHLAWGAAGMLLLVRRFGLGRTSAIVAALGWALSGPITAVASAGQLLPAAAWFPWCGVSAVALARRLGGTPAELARGIALGALAPAAALLLGEVFQAALTILFGVVVGVAWRARSLQPAPPLRWPRALGATFAALALAAAIAAVLLLPLFFALRATERGAGLTREIAEQWSLHPLRLTELVAPGAMGDPYGAYPGGRWAGDGAPDDRPLIYGVYLGASLLVLALAGLGAPPTDSRRWQRPAIWLGGLALLALLLALGRHTPVHAIFRWIVPLFSYQRAPEKFVLLLVPAVALLAGFGVERVLSTPRALLGPAAGVAGALVLLSALPLFVAAPVAATIGSGARHGLVAVAGLLATFYLAGRTDLGQRRPELVLGLVPAIVIADLTLAALPLLVFGPRQMLDERPALAAAILADWGPVHERPRVVRDSRVEAAIGRLVTPGDLVRLEALRYATLRPSFLTAHALAVLPGYDAALPPELPRVWQHGQSRALALLRLLAVDYVVLPLPATGVADLPGLRFLGAPGPPGVGLYRVREPLPRVYVAPSAAPLPALPPAAEAAALLADDVVSGHKVLLGADTSPTFATGAPRACAVAALAHDRIEADCEASAPAHAVFVAQFGAGWTATVDGAPVPIHRANTLMRAVAIPSGRHRVVMTYHPPGFSAGRALSLVGIALALAAGFAATMRARLRRDRAEEPTRS